MGKKVKVRAKKVPLNLGLQKDKKMLYFTNEDEVKEVEVTEQIAYYIEENMLEVVEEKKKKEKKKDKE